MNTTNPNNSSQSLDALEAKIGRRQTKQVAITALVSLVPVAVALAFLWVTYNEIRGAQTKLDEVNEKVLALRAEADTASALSKRLQQENDAILAKTKLLQTENLALTDNNRQLSDELAEARKRLQETTDLAINKYDLTWEEVKILASKSDQVANLLARILEFRDEGIGWSSSNTLEKGFNSPNFAGFVLQELGYAPTDVTPYQALTSLPQDNGEPKLGDVVMYDGGFAMFFFRDREDEEFVAGMTFEGIIALKVDFGAERLGVIRTGVFR